MKTEIDTSQIKGVAIIGQDFKGDVITRELTANEKRLIALDRMRDEYKEFLEAYGEVMESVENENKFRHQETAFQDDEGVVYTLEKPKGTFTYYKNLVVKRTNRPSTGSRGSAVLAKKTAEEIGFSVDVQKKKKAA